MKGFPLRAVPERVCRAELPHATVTVEKASGRTYMTIEENPIPINMMDRFVHIDTEDEADALARAIRASARLLPKAGPAELEAAAKSLEEMAAQLRERKRGR